MNSAWKKISSLLLAVALMFSGISCEVLTAAEAGQEWEEYVGDMDAFVYGLLVRQYELFYDVFSAVMELPDGTEIYGIAYTDYAGVFEGEEGEKSYFPAGFIPLIGEDPVPTDLPDEGIEIIDAEYDDPKCGFVFAYETHPFTQHCVIWNHYLQYGIDENGSVKYEASPYQRGHCNEELGALYSYDEGRLVFNPEVGQYVSVNGISLSMAIDYQDLEKEINRILKEQDNNFWTEEIQTAVYESQEAMVSCLLSMQEERFFGYDVKELVQLTSAIDPMECIRITPDGFVMVDFETDFLRDPNSLAKWLTGACCLITVAGCIAVDLFIPALSPVSGSIMGIAVEVFTEVVIQNHALADVNWRKVAIAATSGALMAWACPLLAGNVSSGSVKLFGNVIKNPKAQELIGKTLGYAALAMSNSTVAGASGYLFAREDGASHEEAVNAALMGAGICAISTLSVSVLAEAARPLVDSFFKTHPNSWMVKSINKASAFINSKRVPLFEDSDLERILIPRSVHESTMAAIEELGSKNVQFTNAINALTSDDNPNFVKLDKDGNIITKEGLKQNNGNCVIKLSDTCDPQLKAVYQEFGITEIPVKDGVPDFSSVSDYSFQFDMSGDRSKNMKMYYKKLAETFTVNPNSMPEKMIKAMDNLGRSSDALNSNAIKEILSAASLTPHEGTDGMVYLVDTYLHKSLSHYGGVAQARAAEELAIVTNHFVRISSSAPKVVTGTYIEGVVYG